MFLCSLFALGFWLLFSLPALDIFHFNKHWADVLLMGLVNLGCLLLWAFKTAQASQRSSLFPIYQTHAA
jgi:endonuclease/exonuclease/phosphatase (EEP) superfamily protein YafD